MQVKRCKQNPILSPNPDHNWESLATFNGCVIKQKKSIYLLYRALTPTQLHGGVPLQMSSIGITTSKNGIRFSKRKQLITPQYDWERFGCEDPRVTYIDGTYVVFYTAISTFPPGASGIKIAVAFSKDLKSIQEKHIVSPFNAKAMALFPQRISKKLTAVLTIHTDTPPVKIALASFDRLEDVYNPQYWEKWYQALHTHVISVKRSPTDHIEIGAAPVKTKKGWLLVYCHIQNYFSGEKIFRIDGLLLDLKNPQKILGQTTIPYLVPQTEYELHGEVPNVIFPTGALIENEILSIYYGAADTTCCLATISLKDALAQFG